MPSVTKSRKNGEQNYFTRRTVLKALPIVGVAGFSSGTVSGKPAFPEKIPLPTGFQPEGIVTGNGHEFFVGSLATGAIYGGDLRTGEGEILNPSIDDRVAVGLAYDPRSDRLFVAGGGTGKAFVYDATTGETADTYTLTGDATFVNDVVITSDAAVFTDSFRPALYRVPLGPAGRLPGQSEVDETPLGGEYKQVAGFNANGIDAPPHEHYLIIVNSTTGVLYTVDPESGEASEIDLDGETLTNGDGILLDGKTLYVVQNIDNRIAVVRLGAGAEEGELVNTITDADFDVPTTIAAFGNALYAVNARFGTPNPETLEYDVVRVSKQ